MTRAVQKVAAVLLSGASLVCGPAVISSAPPQVELAPDSQALALVAAPALVEAPTVTTIAAPALAPAPEPAPFTYPTSPDQWFAPSGGNHGTEGLALFLAGIALKDNAPLYISEQQSRTTGSPNSDHFHTRTDSWAIDVAVRGIQAPTPQTHLAARRIAVALGEPNWAGGDLTKTINGYRFQVLWLVAGHYNHVHVGVRKV
jgi:hypothetical protein